MQGTAILCMAQPFAFHQAVTQLAINVAYTSCRLIAHSACTNTKILACCAQELLRNATADPSKRVAFGTGRFRDDTNTDSWTGYQYERDLVGGAIVIAEVLHCIGSVT